MQPQQYPQPPQPQYAPAPQYAPPAPQYAPAPGYPPAGVPANYPAPGQYVAVQPQPTPAAPPMPAMDEFRSPPPAAANVARPRLMDIGAGRLVLFRPTRVERDLPVPDPKEAALGKTQDRITTDVIVLDGAPFAYGGKPERGVPHTHTSQIGEVHLGVWNSNKVMVSQLERSVDPNARLMVLGRLTQVQGADLRNNPSWRLTDPTEADRAIAREWKRLYDLGQHPQSAPIAAPAQQPAPQYAPVPSAPPAQQYAPPAPQYAPAPPPPAPPAAPAPVALNCPANIDPAWFYAQTPDVQQYYVAQAQATAGPQPGQPAQWS